jgi:2-polyprenyl-6-methoxyphenol hydroxylase-like FAD-dependent oxidoreductase
LSKKKVLKEMETDVLVLGGGIGGLAAALSLSNAGHRVHLLERAVEFSEIGAGVQVGPNGYKMLDKLGLAREVENLAVFPERLVMMDSVSGEVVTSIPTGKAFVERFHYPYTVTHRADLHGVLLAACRSQPRIKLSNGYFAEKYRRMDDGSVELDLRDGSVMKAKALIAADGIWSVIRQQLIGDGAPRVSGHIAYRAVLPTSDVPEQYRQQAMIVWAGPRNHLVQYPLRGGELFNLVAVFHSDRYVEGWNTKGDPAELRQRFAGTCDTVQALLGKIDDWRMWVLCDREPASTWSDGPVTLLGDAAHPMLQYLAQGACMALEDAVVLTECVEASGNDFAIAFREYEQKRYLRTGRCQLMARVYGEVYHASGVARELRNNMLANMSQQDLYNGLAWLYDF